MVSANDSPQARNRGKRINSAPLREEPGDEMPLAPPDAKETNFLAPPSGGVWSLRVGEDTAIIRAIVDGGAGQIEVEHLMILFANGV